MSIFELFQYSFIQRALIAGIFIAVCCSLLGLFLVLRRFSLIGDGLAHVSFGTIALGLLLNVYPLYISLPLVMLASLFILRLTESAGLYGDTAIGLLSSLGIAGGVILASIAGGFNVDLFSYLFGNILSISRAEVVLTSALSFIIIGAVLLFYHDLFSITFDEDYAAVSGIKVKRINSVLALLTAVTVVLGIKVVGTMLVSSLIILPSAASLQIARGFKKAIITAVLFAVCSVVAGIIISFAANLPAGATVVVINFFFFCLAFSYGKWRG